VSLELDNLVDFMLMEIKVLAWGRHLKVTRLSKLIRFQPKIL